MTFEDQVAAVTAHGFTVRQGRFLTTVLRHSGVCLRRQYYAFNGIQPGQVGCDFFEKLVSRRFASVYPYGPSGARLYHVHHKALYRAIGEPDSRLRRRGTVVRAVERLMVLDTLAKFRAGIEWLSTEHEKVTYFVHNRELSAKDLPSVSFAGASTSTTRYFADKLPVGIQSGGDDVTFVYVATTQDRRPFREFLQRHEPLLLRLRAWRIVVGMPRHAAAVASTHLDVFREFCAAPVRPSVLDEFRWFCEVRRTAEQRGDRASAVDLERYARARRAFGAPRFFSAYRRWRDVGEPALLRLISPTLHDSYQRGTVALDLMVLPHLYGEVGVLVRTA